MIIKEPFNTFMSQLRETNITLESLTDFKKVVKNVNRISLKLCQLNHLLGRDDIEDAVVEVYDENPKAFSVLGILVAVRDKKRVLKGSDNVVDMESYFTSVDNICQYLNETGLEGVFKSKKITNLVDYVFGVEVGLDTNARKNRGGKIMEKYVASIFDKAGIVYREQVASSEFEELKSLGKDLKKFDFVVETQDVTYFIETNFYNGGGSKLNETARAYTDIAPKINRCPNFEFVWITDGQGWNSAKTKLEEAFDAIPNVYNLSTLDNFVSKMKL